MYHLITAATTTFILGDVAPNTVDVLWQSIPDAQMYRLSITGPDGVPQTREIQPGQNVMNYRFENLNPGTTYTVGLTAVTPTGEVPLGTVSPTTPGKLLS